MTETKEKAPRRPSSVTNLRGVVDENINIHVQNQLSTITYFETTVGGVTQQSEFAPLGDAQGEDVMELPSTYLLLPKFKEACRKGIFKIVEADDEDVIEAYRREESAFEARQQAKSESDRFVEAQQPKGFSGHQCLAQEGKSQCSEYAIYAKDTRERPPLCSKHAHLASQFTPEETGTFTNGKPDINWVRVSILGR